MTAPSARRATLRPPGSLPCYEIAILGAGPSGTGPLVCAGQNGRLDALLDHGIALIDEGPTLGGGRMGDYYLDTNSKGTTFIECLEKEGGRPLWGHLLEDDIYKSIAARRLGRVPLRWIAHILRRITEVIGAKLEAHPRCALFSQTRASWVRVEADGWATVGLSRAPAARGAGADVAHDFEIRARTVVLALGGVQNRTRICNEELVPGVRIADARDETILPSGRVMTDDGLGELMTLIRAAAKPHVVIVGGSHSAFGTAWSLLTVVKDYEFLPDSISILHRSPIRVQYQSRDEARADHYEFTEANICPETGRIHRGGGLVGHEVLLWQSITGRSNPAERRVVLHHLSKWHRKPDELKDLLRNATAVVPCLGYHVQSLPMFDSSGKRLSLVADQGGDLVDDNLRVALGDGTALSNVFGIGLGAGFRATNLAELEPSFEGHANGVWLYQNTIAERLLSELSNQLGYSLLDR